MAGTLLPIVLKSAFTSFGVLSLATSAKKRNNMNFVHQYLTDVGSQNIKSNIYKLCHILYYLNKHIYHLKEK